MIPSNSLDWPTRVLSPALAALGAVVLIGSHALAQSRAQRPQPYALRGVRLSVEDETLRTVILRDGLIEAILDLDAEVPAGCQHVDGEGLMALPTFLDPYTHTGCETPEPAVDADRPVAVNADVPIDMRAANRKGIQPSFAAVDVLDLGESGPEAHRRAGYGLLLSAPAAQILSGKSVLATTRDAALRDVVVRGDVFQHAAFRASGGGYPSTVMGYHAQLRQLFYDAQRQVELGRRFEAGKSASRPTFDRGLDAGAELLGGERTLVCEAESVRDIRRWIRLSEEFGLKIAISGGREAWKCAAELVERDIPVFLTLNWGDEVDDPDEGEEEDEGEAEADEGEEAEADEEDEEDGEADDEETTSDEEEAWIYEQPIEVRRERRRLWEEGRDCALRLHEAKVRFAFGSGGEKPKALLKKVRTLVEEGLERDVALAALTSSPAELLGVGAAYGELSPGRSAALALWTDDPLEEKKAKVAWLFIDGFAHDLEVDLEEEAAGGDGPAEGLDLTGMWSVEDGSDEGGESVLDLVMEEDGALSGTIRFELAGSERTEKVEGTVSGNDVVMRVSLSMEGVEVSTKLEGTHADGVVEGDMTITFPGGEQKVKFKMTRMPERSEKGGL